MSGVVVGGATIIITGFFLEEGIRALIKETTSCATRHVVCNAVTIGTGGTGIADGVTGDIKGMQVTGSNNYDGNVPSVVLYEEDGSELAFEEGHGKTKDPFPLATGHVPERQNGEPAYISVTSSGDDAICIAWVTVTSNTGSATTWTGDMGKACEGIQWAPSNRPIDQNSRYTPDCVWIDNPSGDEGAPIHQAFSFHIKDFIGEKGRAAQYRANTESLCNSKPRMHFYEQHKFHEPIAVFQPPLEYNEDGTDKDLTKVIGVEGFIKEQHHEEGLIAKRDNETETPRIPPAKRAQKFRERLARELIYSHHSHHSAREVCEDPSSLSSDIVSHEEGMWCDWTNRRLLPLCSNTDAGGNDCFDEVEHDVRPRIRVRGSKPKKTKRYAKISTWGVAKKR